MQFITDEDKQQSMLPRHKKKERIKL